MSPATRDGVRRVVRVPRPSPVRDRCRVDRRVGLALGGRSESILFHVFIVILGISATCATLHAARLRCFFLLLSASATVRPPPARGARSTYDDDVPHVRPCVASALSPLPLALLLVAHSISVDCFAHLHSRAPRPAAPNCSPRTRLLSSRAAALPGLLSTSIGWRSLSVL